jgi:hypothetical protein
VKYAAAPANVRTALKRNLVAFDGIDRSRGPLPHG